MEKIVAGVLIGLGILVLIAGLSLLGAYPVMLMVNYVFAPSALVAVFGIPQLTFWKAYWLLFVIEWLFKSSTSTKKD